MPKLSLKPYTLIFALLFAVTAYFLFDLHQSHNALKASVKVLETGLIDEIEQLSLKIGELDEDYQVLEETDTKTAQELEDLRNTKADITKKKNDEKNTVSSYSAERILSKWAERYK